MFGLQAVLQNKSFDLIGHSSQINFTREFDIDSINDKLNV